MNQFIKIPKKMISKKNTKTDLSVLGVYSIVYTFFSVPEFKTPNGGLLNAITRHCTNGKYSANNALKKLKSQGYLKRTRMPVSHNKFYDHYDLYNKPHTELPDVRFIDLATGRQLIRDAKNSCKSIDTDFIMIEREMILDPNISLKAKGLYILIKNALLLSDSFETVIVTKKYVKKKCDIGAYSFNKCWKDLKQRGYLKSEKQYYNKIARKTVFKYALFDFDEGVRKISKRKRKKACYEDVGVCDGATNEEIYNYFVDKFSYTRYVFKDQNKSVIYTQGDVHYAIKAMSDYIKNKQGITLKNQLISPKKLKENLLNLTVDNFHSALNTFAYNKSKSNPEKYLVSLLYSRSCAC